MTIRFWAVCALLVLFGLRVKAGQGDGHVQELLQKANAALQDRKLTDAHNLLDQAEKENPKQAGLWYARGMLDLAEGLKTEALEAFKNELAIDPRDGKAATQATYLLMNQSRFAEAVEVLRKPIEAAPENYDLQTLRVRVLVRGANPAEGIAEAERIAKATSEAKLLNNLAYYLSEANAGLALAQTLAEKAVTGTELSGASVHLNSLERGALVNANALAMDWDTLGWIYYRQGNLAKAEPYLKAAWLLGQHPACVEHLQEIFGRGQFGGEAADGLEKLRAIAIPSLPKSEGQAEFYVVTSSGGITEARFLSGSAALKDAGQAIQSTKYAFPFPDASAVKVIRRGTLVCSGDSSPSCRFFFLPATKALAKFGAADTSFGGKPANDGDFVKPALLKQPTPKYSEAARQAGVEGTVELSVLVDAFGLPREMKVTKPLGYGLDEEAKKCVAQWRFRPAMRNGVAEKFEAKISVTFKIFGS